MTQYPFSPPLHVNDFLDNAYIYPLSNLFNDYIVKRIAFSPIGTEEEGKDDMKSVKEAFTPFYEEFEREFF